MTLHLEGIYICHIPKQWLRRPYRYSLSAKNEMKILVKMVSKESSRSKKTPMSFGTNLTLTAQRGPPFVLVVVPQYNVGRSRFVAGDHSSCAIFCFDIHA